MTAAKFKFKPKTIRMPWTPECREFFGLHEDEPTPAYYSVKIGLKSATLTCSTNGPGIWRNRFFREIPNIFNVALLKSYK